LDLNALAVNISRIDADQHRWIAPYERFREENIPRLDRDGYTYRDLAREEIALLERLKLEAAWHEIERSVIELCQQFWSASAPEAQQMRALVRPARGVRWVLMDLAARCGASLAEHSWVSRLRWGLAAIALEDFVIDNRESLMAMADLYHGAEVAGLDPQPWFQEAARRAGPGVAETMAEFATDAILAERRQRPEGC
jgi:hypothetical protein